MIIAIAPVVGIGIALLFGFGILLFAKGGDSGTDKTIATTFYRGLGFNVRKDGSAFRWTVTTRDTPIATGLSVLEEEAAISARNWIDMATDAGNAVISLDAVPPTSVWVKIAKPVLDEPSDLTKGNWYVADAELVADYFILVQTSTNGYHEPLPGIKIGGASAVNPFGAMEHFRWTLTNGPSVIARGWAATPRDARDEAFFRMLGELYSLGIDLADHWDRKDDIER